MKWMNFKAAKQVVLTGYARNWIGLTLPEHLEMKKFLLEHLSKIENIITFSYLLSSLSSHKTITELLQLKILNCSCTYTVHHLNTPHKCCQQIYKHSILGHSTVHRVWRALPTEMSTTQVCRQAHTHTEATSLMFEAPRLHHRYVLQLHYMEAYSLQHEMIHLENSTSKTYCKGGSRSTTRGWGRQPSFTTPLMRIVIK